MGSSSNNGVVPPVSHTQITYNNYYNNGTSGEAAPAGAAPAPAAMAPAAVPADAPPAAATGASPAPPAPSAEPNQQQQQSQEQQNAPSPLGFIISDAELQKLTEDLYSKDANNAFKHITMKVQGQKTDDSVTDDASEKWVAWIRYVKFDEGFVCENRITDLRLILFFFEAE